MAKSPTGGEENCHSASVTLYYGDNIEIYRESNRIIKCEAYALGVDDIVEYPF